MELKLDVNDYFFRQLTLTTTYSTTHIETRQMIACLENERIATDELVTHTVGLDQMAEAIELLEEADESLKIVVGPQV